MFIAIGILVAIALCWAISAKVLAGRSQSKTVSIGGGFLVTMAILAGISYLLVDAPSQRNQKPTAVALAPETAEVSDPFSLAAGNLATGVKLYFGPQKFYVGEVLGGSSRCVSGDGRIFKGVKLRMASSSEEWKDRAAIVNGDWYVRRDDPAIKAMQWDEYLCIVP